MKKLIVLVMVLTLLGVMGSYLYRYTGGDLLALILPSREPLDPEGGPSVSPSIVQTPTPSKDLLPEDPVLDPTASVELEPTVEIEPTIEPSVEIEPTVEP
ncbi:MAG: hypothetical protein II368_06585, partial [Clostridia bacterium]|nr:hypothetical protein [Clostridia bacterium]